MSTQKWSDDDLDDLFRRSAEESDPAYDPSAWQQLKRRLNNYDRLRLLTRIIPALLLLLLVGTALWHAYLPVTLPQKQPVASTNIESARLLSPTKSVAKSFERKSKKQLDNQLTTEADLPKNSIQPTENTEGIGQTMPTSRPKVYASTRLPNRANSPIAITNRRNQPNQAVITDATGKDYNLAVEVKFSKAAELTLRAKTKPLFKRGRPIDPPTDIARQNAKTGGLGRHRSVMSGFIPPSKNAETFTNNRITPPSFGENHTEKVESAGRFSWPTPALLSIRKATWGPMPNLPTEPTLVGEAQRLPTQARSRPAGLSIQLVLSPDLSTIGLHNFDRPGSNMGVMLQYRLSNRVSLQAGALWSTKIYKTAASEYVWPSGGYTTVLPESITGNCSMFDIPLNVRYDVLLRPGQRGWGPSRWFVSGGVTSYFINHEAYDFTYANPTDPAIKWWGWDNRVAGQKGGRFGLSNLNISVGYEKPISQRLSWQIEPFMKLPIQPIGHYKVRLLSTGAFLSLRYRL